MMMTNYLKNILPACIFIFAVACNNANEPSFSKDQLQKINLFPESNTQNVNDAGTKQLSNEAALKQSCLAFTTSNIRLIDSSDKSRSSKICYFYKVENGRLIKALQGRSTRLPIYFIATQKIIIPTNNNDSMTVFLTDIGTFKIWHQYLSINYKWLPSAPEFAKLSGE